MHWGGGGGGVQVNLTKKLTTFFVFWGFFSPQLIIQKSNGYFFGVFFSPQLIIQKSNG